MSNHLCLNNDIRVKKYALIIDNYQGVKPSDNVTVSDSQIRECANPVSYADERNL